MNAGNSGANQSTGRPESKGDEVSSHSAMYRWCVGFGLVLMVSIGIVLCFDKPLCERIFPEYFAVLCLLGNEAIWFQFESQKIAREKERFEDVKKLARFFTFFIVFGFYLLCRLGWTDAQDRHRLLFVILLWGLAFLTLGGFVGFLFGIPRTLAGSIADRKAEAQNANGTAEGQATSRVNTNLERVSDWLTQIIVGGTITQVAIFPHYARLIGEYYANHVGVEGASAKGWVLAGAGNTLYFLLTGFLGSYLLTRLYLAGAISRADGSGSAVAQLPNLSSVELEALEAAPLHYGEDDSIFDPLAKAAADKILKLDLDELSNWRDLRVWSKAQLAAKQPERAIEGYVRVIDIILNDAETRLGYAIALGQAKNQKRLILDQLERARAAVMPATPPDLRKNIYKSLLYAVLFIKAPDSFRQTLKYAREYFADPTAVPSAGILFNIACAYGQAHAWLKADPTRTLFRKEFEYQPSCDPDIPLPNPQASAFARDTALAVLKLALERSPGYREKLKVMITKPPPEDADDFQSLADEKDFQQLAGT